MAPAQPQKHIVTFARAQFARQRLVENDRATRERADIQGGRIGRKLPEAIRHAENGDASGSRLGIGMRRAAV